MAYYWVDYQSKNYDLCSEVAAQGHREPWESVAGQRAGHFATNTDSPSCVAERTSTMEGEAASVVEVHLQSDLFVAVTVVGVLAVGPAPERTSLADLAIGSFAEGPS